MCNKFIDQKTEAAAEAKVETTDADGEKNVLLHFMEL